MAEDLIEFEPQQLDTFLRKELHLDLFRFSELAFEVVRWKKIFPERRLRAEYDSAVDDGLTGEEPDLCERVAAYEQTDRHVLISLKKKIDNLEAKIIDVMLEIEVLMERDKDRRRENNKSEEFRARFAKEYEIEQFFGLLNDYRFEIEELLQKSSRGAPVNRRNLLCAVWAQYLIENKRVVNWRLVADLMDWFWAKFKQYDVYKDFQSSQDQVQPEYLKNQFYKQKKRWGQYYRAIRPRTGEGWSHMYGAQIIVFGKKPKEIDHFLGHGMEGVMRGMYEPNEGPGWELALKIYRSRTSRPKKKNFIDAKESAKVARLNWLVIFPDNTYAIDPE